MTTARVRATQTAQPPKPARMRRGIVTQVAPLTVQIGGAAVAGLPIPGATYAAGDAVLVLWQEPGIGPVYPLSIPAAAPTTGAFAYAGTGGNWDTSTRQTSVTRSGPHGLLNLQMTVGATPPTANALLLTIGATPAGFRPARIVNAVVPLFSGGWGNQTATLDLGTDGRLLLSSSSVPIPAGGGIFGTIPYPLV